jgi:phosphoglycolate phosphatase-like HAD superfamily hydrolase
LVVDLDGTLVKTDLLIESVFSLLRKQPQCLFLLPVWLAHGKAWFKHEVARRVSLDIASLPWRSELIEDLKRQRSEGRSLVLATGSDMGIARQTAEHLKLFDLVLASDGITNLCGEAKLPGEPVRREGLRLCRGRRARRPGGMEIGAKSRSNRPGASGRREAFEGTASAALAEEPARICASHCSAPIL